MTKTEIEHILSIQRGQLQNLAKRFMKSSGNAEDADDIVQETIETRNYLWSHLSETQKRYLQMRDEEAMTPDFFWALSEASMLPLPIMGRLGITNGSGIL